MLSLLQLSSGPADWLALCMVGVFKDPLCSLLLVSDSFVQSKVVKSGDWDVPNVPNVRNRDISDQICTGNVPKCPHSERSGRPERPDRPDWTHLDCTNEPETGNNKALADSHYA